MDPGRAFPRGLRAGSYLRDLSHVVPELGQLARLTVTIPYNRDSADLTPRHWTRLARLIDGHRDGFDAFVVVHGTDTMAFTASALSFALAGLGKPIVLTGSQRPLKEIRSDARQNLINAVTAAASGKLHEVAICFGSFLLRGNRARKMSTARFDAFQSPNWPPLARLGLFVEWQDSALLPRRLDYVPAFGFGGAVARLPIVPGQDPRMFAGLRADAILLEGFGTGNIPGGGAGWLEQIRAWTRRGALVVLSTQCVEGPLSPELYEAGRQALLAGAISAEGMTREAILVKLQFCLKNQRDFRGDIAGEGCVRER